MPFPREKEKAKVSRERATIAVNLAIRSEIARNNQHQVNQLKEDRIKAKETKARKVKKARAKEKAIKALAGRVEW